MGNRSCTLRWVLIAVIIASCLGCAEDGIIIPLAKQTIVFAYPSDDQYITATTETLVRLDTEDCDVRDEFDSKSSFSFTTTVTDIYLLIGQVSFYSGDIGDQQVVRIKVNGTSVSIGIINKNSSQMNIMTSRTIILTPGDVITLTAENVNNNAMIVGASTSSFLSITALGGI